MKRITAAMHGIFISLIASSASAQELISGSGSGNELGFKAILAITAGFAIAIATLAGAIGQSKVATAAMEGIARNPESAGKIMTPMIIALALIESLVIYTLVIAFLLQGKI